MSECVVRMEIPSCCHDCPFEADQWDYPICRVTGRSEGYRFDARNNRMVDCPIICSLPEGHGDLVDWKDVEKELDRLFCNVVEDVSCMGPYMLKRKEYPQALIERPIRVNIIVPAERK